MTDSANPAGRPPLGDDVRAVPIRFTGKDRELIQGYADQYHKGVFAEAVRGLCNRGLAAEYGTIINPEHRKALHRAFSAMPYGGTADIVPLALGRVDPYSTINDVVDSLAKLAGYLEIVSASGTDKDRELDRLRGLMRGGGALLQELLGNQTGTAAPKAEPDPDGLYRVQRHYHLTSGRVIVVTVGGQDRALMCGELMVYEMEPVGWELAGQEEPPFPQPSRTIEQIRDDVTAELDATTKPQEEQEPPMPPGMLVLLADGEQVIIPIGSVEYVEIVQLDPAGNRVKAEPGWPAETLVQLAAEDIVENAAQNGGTD